MAAGPTPGKWAAVRPFVMGDLDEEKALCVGHDCDKCGPQLHGFPGPASDVELSGWSRVRQSGQSQATL